LLNSFVSIRGDDEPLQRQVEGVRSQLGVMGVAIGTAAGNLLSSAISGAAAAFRGFIGQTIGGAMALQDTMSATDAIFGESSAVIFRWADDMAARFGAVKNETILAAQQFGSSFKAIGMSAEASAGLGVQLAKLGMDMASFKGARNEEAFTAINAALRGEFDPLERFNVMLSAATVGAEAVRMGLAKNATQLDENAKKQATLSLIMERTKDQQGDLERTSDQSTNTWNRLTGTITNLAAELGTTLMPAITAVLNLGADMVGGLSAAFERNKETIASWAKSFADAIRSIPQAWDEFQTGISIGVLKMEKTLTEGAMLAERRAGMPGTARGALAALGLLGPNDAGPKDLDAAIDQLGDDLRRRTEDRAAGTPRAGDLATMRDAASGALALAGVDATKGLAPAPKDTVLAGMGIPSLRDLGLGALGSGAIGVAGQVREAYEKKHPFESASFDPDDFYYKMRDAALGGEDDRAKEQLAAQQKTAENTGKIADSINRGLYAKLA
jgi:hypothetical protein